MHDEPRTYWDPGYVYTGPPAVPVRTADTRPAINLAKVPPERKRATWEALKREKPELADLIASDGMRILMEKFGGSPVIPEDDLPDSVLESAGRTRRKPK